jgi:choline dehydrogenase-like flavoprotein
MNQARGLCSWYATGDAATDIRADKEVILAAGAIGSPKLLITVGYQGWFAATEPRTAVSIGWVAPGP